MSFSKPFRAALASSLSLAWSLQATPPITHSCNRRWVHRTFAMVSGVAPPVTSHLSLVPQFLSQTLKQGDVAVDATAGNGYDTLSLAQLVLSADGGSGRVIYFDVQNQALETTRSKLLSVFSEKELTSRATQLHTNHRDIAILDEILPSGSLVKAFTYNLGYLPGGDKSIVTQFEDTLVSLRGASKRTAPGGLICVTCYTGHVGGREETDLVRLELTQWSQSVWRVCEHKPLNWPSSPILFTAHKFEMPRVKLPKRNQMRSAQGPTEK